MKNRPKLAEQVGGREMSAKTYLTIASVIAVLFGLAFLLAPTAASSVYGVPADAHTSLILQFFGSTLVGIGAVQWVAKDFRDWDAVRGILIAAIVGDALGLIVNLLGTFQGLLNGMAWTTTIIYVLLIIGAVYCLSAGAETSVAAKPAR
jgi:FtsH-binding integral membrane protein